MKALTIEFLIPQSENNSFCDNKDTFIKLLQVDSKIKTNKNNILYNGNEFPFKIEILKAEEKKHKCFHLTIDSDITLLEDFTKLKRLLLKNLSPIFESSLQVLWDDIDKYYSTIAYPIIKDIENLMRKFLSEFLLINVGVAWTDDSVSSEIKQKADRKPQNNNLPFLSSLDFIDLAEFLFEKYTNHNQQAIFAKIQKAQQIKDIVELKEMLPRSNWERYFKDALDCNENLISDNWKKLYALRCKVAHNSSFSKPDLENLNKLVSEVKPVIMKAIDSLKDIHIPDNEKAIILENNIQSDEKTLSNDEVSNSKYITSSEELIKAWTLNRPEAWNLTAINDPMIGHWHTQSHQQLLAEEMKKIDVFNVKNNKIFIDLQKRNIGLLNSTSDIRKEYDRINKFSRFASDTILSTGMFNFDKVLEEAQTLSKTVEPKTPENKVTKNITKPKPKPKPKPDTDHDSETEPA